MSKGSKRRPGQPGAYERGYEAIDWSKGRPAPASRESTVEWVIPSLDEILGPRCGQRDDCQNSAAEPHTCPYAEEIGGDFETLCTCCPDCTHKCAQDI